MTGCNTEEPQQKYCLERSVIDYEVCVGGGGGVGGEGRAGGRGLKHVLLPRCVALHVLWRLRSNEF